MDRAYEIEDRISLVKGAQDIAKEVKKQAVKKANKAVDRAQDGYTERSYNRFQGEEENDYYSQGGNYEEANEDEGSSEATEGHDEDDEIYEGEYQGIPSTVQNKDGIAALRQQTTDVYKDTHELETERKADEEELAQQYELIIQECGHGRFQWALFFVLGMALMADGVEVFVVGFVLPSAETDMCIPNSGSGWLGWSFSMGSAYQFHSWRVFVIMCALPCVSAVVALTFMPESPRFLLETGKHDEAWMILKQIHDTNMRARGQPEKVFTVNRIKMPKQVDELIEIESDTGTWYRRCYVRVRTELDIFLIFSQIWLTFMRCFTYPVKDNTIKLAVVWFTLSFGYYGLSVWFPDVIKHLQADEYASKVKNFNNKKIVDFDFNFTLENQIHFNETFINDRFKMMTFKSVIFQDVLFQNCYFEDVTTLNTYFRNCTFIETVFFSTDLEPYKYPGSEFINCTFFHNKTGCQISYDDDYSAYWIYFVNFLGTLAVLPGNIVSALLMDRIGRLTMLGGSMILSGISCFFLWFGTSGSMMIGMLCLYNGLTISAWNSLDVITVELYPTDRRATGFGFLNALCKAAAVLGNLIFGSFVVITKSVPILLASTVLVCGGLVGLRLPDTRTQVLM
ncbi:synaptic vesicle glycoprotein 2C isoform X4 [Python bivittatus]|uniref:Synaptic vesicle glycoprotein 2C isoform X4 n=1 Tax=Python bivittatus TaxID=176946 RepID=A0A9F5IY76_PYTBI|nr:synaptic vesicle glycoprotein 2C isoform X4 [Python bivittatus]